MYNFLTVGGDKYGAKSFTIGSNGKIVSVQEALDNISLPLCWAGNYKITLLNHCQKNNLKFYNLDTGYFGNFKRKEYKRISINAFQDLTNIQQRPDDRLERCILQINDFKRGTDVVILPPDSKKAHTLGIDVEKWIDDLVKEIKIYTDRPIRVRQRPLERADRIEFDTFTGFIAKNTNCVIGYSTNALVESIICGIPVIAIGPSATKSYSNHNLSQIDNLPNIDREKRYSWLCHLSYKQFTEEEMLSGLAWDLLCH